jgi:PAS domain-containing protein
MSDATDPLWDGPMPDVKFGGPAPPEQPKQFLARTVAAILRGRERAPADFRAAAQWVATAPVFALFAEIARNAIPHARAIVLGEPFCCDDAAVLVPEVLGRFLASLQFPLPANFAFGELLAFLRASAPRCVGSEARFAADLLPVLRMILSGSAAANLDRYAEIIASIGIALVPGAAERERECIGRLFVKNAPIMAIAVCGKGMFRVWLPALVKLFGGEIPELFAEALLPYLDAPDEERLRAREAGEVDRQRLDEIDKKWAVFQKKTVSVAAYADASFKVTRCRYIAICKHYLLAEYLAHVMQG